MAKHGHRTRSGLRRITCTLCQRMRPDDQGQYETDPSDPRWSRWVCDVCLLKREEARHE